MKTLRKILEIGCMTANPRLLHETGNSHLCDTIQNSDLRLIFSSGKR